MYKFYITFVNKFYFIFTCIMFYLLNSCFIFILNADVQVLYYIDISFYFIYQWYINLPLLIYLFYLQFVSLVFHLHNVLCFVLHLMLIYKFYLKFTLLIFHLHNLCSLIVYYIMTHSILQYKIININRCIKKSCRKMNPP